MTKISKGNSKLGHVWNVPLPPIKSCRPDAPCFKHCYALKAYRQYKGVKAAWDYNLELLNNDMEGFFSSIHYQLSATKNPPRFFRWHVSGDIRNQSYLDNMISLAAEHPSIKFLCFTKMYNLDFSDLPGNLSIVLSAWPGFDLDNKYGLPVAYMQDGTENRAIDCIECPGNCETCGMCWELKNIGKNVVFHKH